MKKQLLPILAILGILFSIFMIFHSRRRPASAEIPFPPPKPPFVHFVAGAGLIEANTENIQIGPPFNEIVTDVYVEAGAIVNEGAPLFKLNTQTLQAQLEQAKKALSLVEQQLANEERRLSYFQKLQFRSGVSEKEFTDQEYAVKIAIARTEEARANVGVLETQISRSTVRAPLEGKVLEINARVGQAAAVNPFDRQQLLLFGNVKPLTVRIDIDENDIWRMEEGAKGVAFVRGNRALRIPLKFVRFEPFVRPKQSLTGDDFERVDTRVLQLIYELEPVDFPLFAGQILDVYLEAKPSDYKIHDSQR